MTIKAIVSLMTRDAASTAGMDSVEYIITSNSRFRTLLLSHVLLLFAGVRVAAQEVPPIDPEDIVVRNNLPTTEVEPLRRFDPQELRAMGISSIADMIQWLGHNSRGPMARPPFTPSMGGVPLMPMRSILFLSTAFSRSSCYGSAN
jgi:hypothetical protein